LGCLRLARYRACLSTIHACGLRLQECTHLLISLSLTPPDRPGSYPARLCC
jgi:hypothetical protein